jgi:hypothetical protein
MSAPSGYLVALRTALVSKLNDDPYFASAVPDGVTYRPTRSPVNLPAVTFQDSGIGFDEIVPLYDRTLIFYIWATDLDECEAIANIVNAALDGQALPLDEDDPYSEEAPALVAYMSLRDDSDEAQNDADVVRKMLTYRLLVYDYSGPEPFRAP